MDPAPGGPSQGEIALWRSLVARALRSGARYEDSQDLASEAVRKALEAHVPERGPFAPFCRTIHANLLKNHWRDRKPIEEFDPETDERESGANPLDEVAFEEGRKMMRRIADQILAALEPQEAAFFLALTDAHREAENVAVTAAARRLGIDPMQGWNLFRRIQRKARLHLEEYQFAVGMHAMQAPPEMPTAAPKEAPKEAPQEAPTETPSDVPPRMEPLHEMICFEVEELSAAVPSAGRAQRAADWFVFLVAGAATAGYERFASALSPGERDRLSALLS